jgi:predicted metal-dependent hydrolase
VESHLQRFAEAAEQRAEEAPLPERLDLAAIGETWSVAYRPAHTQRIGVSDTEPGQLVVYGAVAAPEGCREALRLWLKRRARETLAPQLAALANEKGFRFQEVLIRGPKRRWASCTARGTICLSYKLLFLEPWAVRSVLLHELCHTMVMDHSPRFWALLARFDPQCRSSRKAMREAEGRVPAWVEA